MARAIVLRGIASILEENAAAGAFLRVAGAGMSSSYKAFCPGLGSEFLESTSIPQTTIFYSQLLPVVHSCCVAAGAHPARICDIGAGTAAGADLIEKAMTHLLGLPATVTAFDLETKFVAYAKEKFPTISYKAMDFFDSDQTFDLAIVSHTLEHMEEPERFVERLCARTPMMVGFVPFEEKPLIEEHLCAFDTARLRSMPNFVWGQAFKSVAWKLDDYAALFVCIEPTLRARLDLVRLLGMLDKYFSHQRIASL
jgi:SAM-dependent methyltransferase